jgi:hypothetical protein
VAEKAHDGFALSRKLIGAAGALAGMLHCLDPSGCGLADDIGRTMRPTLPADPPMGSSPIQYQAPTLLAGRDPMGEDD